MWANSHLKIIFALCTECLLTAFGSNNPQPKGYDDNEHLIIESAKDRNNLFILRGDGFKTDKCVRNLCQNGGTCIDFYDDFRCKCPENWRGKTCDVDVDECSILAGTDLVCQNNAICINTIGNYRCECTQGWKGLHCNQREVDCYTSPKELCGNGVCLPQNNDWGYSCICNEGWKSNSNTPACTDDVNECEELKHRCVSKCINLPGDFMCGPCPAGYTGDGISCKDIDECKTNNGGCSRPPHVNCINTQGSYRCGACPVGYTTNGTICYRDENSCQNYGICHPQASCRYNSKTVVCTCPPGSTGNGYGPTGCSFISVDACNSNHCTNGSTCRPHGDSYICLCPPGFEGDYCQIPDQCKSNPCKNGATCLLLSNENYTCLCTSEFQGTHCEDDRVICGTILNLESGFITYPRSGYYNPNERCIWAIKTQKNKILNVTFTKFDLQEHPSCLRDFLQIHDGQSTAAQLIGQFCGNKLPKGGHFTSTRNMLYFWFRSDSIVQKNGFSFSWNTVDPICGGRFKVNTQGVIQSPGYPVRSPPNRHCEWVLEAPPGKVLEIAFDDINLPKNGNCEGDFLEVLDNGIEKRSLNKFCNQTTPPTIKSGSNEVIIIFRTHSSSSGSFFLLHYAPVETVYLCGGVFTQPEGSFQSPKNGTFGGNEITCNYLIQTTRDTVIHLNFPFLNSGTLVDCKANSLMIFDGKTDKDSVIDTWCGFGTLGNYTSTLNAILIQYRFLSNLNGVKLEFRAHYNIGCGGVYKERSGAFVSPNSPQEYLPNMHCFYTIEVPQGFAITLRMEYFELTNKNCWTSDTCNHTDHIIVYSPVVNNASMVGIFCRDFPTEIVSKYNRMIVEFFTNDTMQFKGFKALYESEEIGCGGVLLKPNGTISFINDKQLQKCEWFLNAPDNQYIFLNFEKFYILDNQSCEKNLLQINDLNENERDKRMGTFCGQNQARSGTFSTNRLSIVFVAELDSPTDEFLVNYKFLNLSPTSCELSAIELTAPSGSLYSPGWPDKYVPKLNCSWILRGPIGQRIVLDVKNFSLESFAPNDYVEIRDGISDALLIGRFYGIKIPSRIISFTNSLYITFITHENVNKGGFHFEWQTTTIGCGGTLTSYEGFIIPPHYPDLISPGAQCDWHIIVNPGSNITAIITSKNFEELGGCDTKQINVFNGNNPLANMIKPNCSEQSLYYTSTKNYMLIRYETEANEKSTFFVNYNAQCGGELRDLRGVVESPNFPNKYSSDLDCRWNIINRKRNKIVVTFSHLDLEGDYNKLHISDLQNGVVLNEYLLHSEVDLRQRITALGDTLQIHYTSYHRVSGTGFRLEYELQGCSKYFKLRKGSGDFQSPDYPYAVDVYCEWIIETDYGKQIKLRISPTKLEGSADDCLKNGLIVYSDEAHNNSLIKICSTHSKEVVAISAGSRMFVTFFTDEVRAKKYFKADFNIVFGRCGGTFSAPEGYITSPNFPFKYSKGDYCEWLVSSGLLHTLDLSLEYFNVPNTTNCEDSFLEVYDGGEKKATHLLLRHCGTTLPLKTLIQSTKHKILVVFSASRTTEPGLGFKIYYKRNCGREIYNIDSGLLIKEFSDNNCLWTISSSNPTQQVTLTFSRAECECDTNLRDYCEQNLGVQIYDGDSIEAPLKTSFCSKHPPAVYSTGQALTIRANRGYFEFDFDWSENTCGGVLKSIRGEFATPGYPNSYPLNVQCVWEIVAEEGNTIELSFNKLQIRKTSEKCNDDYVEVRQREEGKLLGLFCGNEYPQTIRAYEVAWIKFRSDGNLVDNGFLATWSYAHESEINGSSGTIKSPPIENVNVDPENYKWRITVPHGHLVEIHFEEYIDGLQFFDGFDETAMSVEFDYKTTITSSTNIIFITSENSVLRPFWIRWQAVSKISTEKIGVVTTFSKQIIVIPMNDIVDITSPGYPTGYDNELNYEWILKTDDPSHHVLLMFFGAELERSPNCINDYVHIYSGENMFHWTFIKSYCSEPLQTRPIAMFHGAPYSKLVFHTDISRNGTGFLFKATTFCGANMTEPEGFIKGVTAFSYIYGPKNCTWRILVPPGKKIKFQFTKMNIPASTDHDLCERYVSIRDGFDEDAALLGQGMFCKGSNLTIPVTATNMAVVHIALNFWDMDWELKYTAVNEVCGGSIRITNEQNSINITTPNYPNAPKPYSNCVWTVLGPPGKSLHLTFLDKFELHDSNGCATEFVEVRDGSTSVARLMEKFCRKRRLIASTGNAIYIRYFTNSLTPKNGFKAHITLSTCGDAFQGYELQDIASKNYPSPGGYPSNSVCEYKISVEKGVGITITFIDVHLPIRQNRSESDHLTIFVEEEENNGTMKELTKIYGDNVPSFVQTYSSEALVKFFTYQPNTIYRGWRLTFKSTIDLCDSRVNSEWGQIIIPRKLFLQESMMCTWAISVPKGRRINLFVDEYGGVDAGKPFDYVLTFYNDDDTKNVILSTTNIGDIKTVKSSENKLIIKLFISNPRNVFAKLNFTSNEFSYCQANITEDSGTFIAPDTSEPYYCSMEYKSTGGQTIALKISELVISYNSLMSNDTIKEPNFYMYIGREINIFEISTNFTDFILPIPFERRSTGRIIMVQNEMAKIKKLVVHYKIHNCGGEYWTSTYNDAVITTPYFNAQHKTLDCAWLVKAALNTNAFLNATFSLNPDCEKEYILIHNGSGPLTPQMEKICRNGVLSHNFTSAIYIHYHKEAIFPSKFKILLTRNQCGGLVYPSDRRPLLGIGIEDYKNNVECVWNLENNFGFTIIIYFAERFFIEDSIDCTKDYLEIRTRLDDEWKIHSRFCGRQRPETFKLTHTNIMIVFRTDNVTVGDGFQMYASQLCGGVFNVTKKPKTVNSLSWSMNSPCIYILQTQTTNRIKVHFNTLDKREPCPENTLEVYKGKSYSEVEKYCSTKDLVNISSTDPVKFIIQANKNGYLHFSFTFQLDSCGGIVTEESTIKILSDEKINCLWNITSPPGNLIFIEFNYLSFHRNFCSEDYVEIFTGHELSTTNRIAHICETTQQNVLYKVSGNKALVFAVTNPALDRGREFSAQITFRKNCDENVMLSPHNFTYIFDRFADGYEDNLNCTYEFSAPSGNYISIEFHSFNITACPFCTCDFLQIRDWDDESYLLDNLCGDRLPPIVISSGNKLFVHFASDDAGVGQGFNATVKFVSSACALININFSEIKEVLIKSPDHTGYYPPNTVCNWEIYYKKPIELHFDKFDLEEPGESGQCLNFFEIFYYPFSFSKDPVEQTSQILCPKHTSSYFMTNKSAKLTYRSNTAVQRHGFSFKLRLADECNTTYTALSGMISKEPDNDECDIYFNLPATYTLAFVLENDLSEPNCSKIVKFYDENTKQQVQTTCASPQTAFINSNNVKVKFFKNTLLPSFSLRMTYIATNSGLGCGGNISAMHGKIASPLYPKFDGNYNCQWNINVPQNFTITISFMEFNIGSVETCSDIYLKVLDVSVTDDLQEMHKFCGNENPGTFTSSQNKLSLIYNKNINFEGTGWVASYHAEESFS